jgi:HlyD family secretion protein
MTLIQAFGRESVEPPVEFPEIEPDGVPAATLVGTVVVVAFVAVAGVWAGSASLAGAVVAQGTVVVDSSVKKVQHQTGGTVAQIRVREGDRVKRGQLLIRLDDTVARANFRMIVKQMDELAIRQARLRAERDGAARMMIPRSLAARRNRPEAAALIARERGLFETRAAARAGQKAQLRERVAQLRQEIQGIQAQLDAKSREIELVRKELNGAEVLWRKKLMPITKLTALQREGARLLGERGRLIAGKAQSSGKISEIELQIIQIDQQTRADADRDLSEAQSREAQLAERRTAAEDVLRHTDIRAPQSGMAHQLSAHTVGGVIAPGEVVMLIVPENDDLVIDAKIARNDIDHVKVGQSAFIRFPAFDMRSTPEFEGSVIRVSADLTREPQSPNAYYVARLGLKDGGGRTGGVGPRRLALLPGMPAEIHIRTTARTALSYFLKPLRDQFARAFTEQ